MARRGPAPSSSSCVIRPLLTLERQDPDAVVLVVTSGWPNEDNDAYCVFIKRQVESLVDRGVRFDVLFIRGYRSKLAYLLAALQLAYWSVAGRRHYRLVHAHGGEAALAAWFYRRAPLLVSYLGDDLLGTPDPYGSISRRSRFRRGLFRRHSRAAAGTITKSREMEAVLPPASRVRNTVLPNGVDTDLFQPADREAARHKLGWDAEARIVLFAADPAVPRKRYWLAKAAVEDARRYLDDIQLEVVRRVAPDHVPVLINAADCLLLTSSIEGSPNVVKEALMCNLPVIATPSGDVRELLAGVIPAYICEPSAQVLSEALVECLREHRRSNGRKMSQWLDARVVADSLLAVYRSLAPGLDPSPVLLSPIGARGLGNDRHGV
jgi:teichuronic acid biosynthesis glycosyltransferase TuaC